MPVIYQERETVGDVYESCIFWCSLFVPRLCCTFVLRIDVCGSDGVMMVDVFREISLVRGARVHDFITQYGHTFLEQPT